MNYEVHYNRLIQKAQARSKPEGYCEQHHILPRSLGGSDDPTNLVWLTAREHFVAHQLLAHMHGGKMWYALWMMSTAQRYGSRQYSWIKERWAETQRGKVLSAETRAKMSATRVGRSQPWMVEVGQRNKGRVFSDEHKQKLSRAKQKRVQQLTLEGKLVAEFESGIKASEATGIPSLYISRAARGYYKQAGGYLWRRP